MSENLPSPQKIYTKKLNWPFRFWFGFERNILRNDICLIAFVALWLSTYFTSTIYLANPKYLFGKNLVQLNVRNWSALCFHLRIKVIKALGCQFCWILQNIPLQKEWQRLRGLVKWSAIDHWQDLCQVRTVTLYAIFPPIYNLMLLLQNLLETFCKQGIEANAVFFGNPSWSLV